MTPAILETHTYIDSDGRCIKEFRVVREGRMPETYHRYHAVVASGLAVPLEGVEQLEHAFSVFDAVFERVRKELESHALREKLSNTAAPSKLIVPAS